MQIAPAAHDGGNVAGAGVAGADQVMKESGKRLGPLGTIAGVANDHAIVGSQGATTDAGAHMVTARAAHGRHHGGGAVRAGLTDSRD